MLGILNLHARDLRDASGLLHDMRDLNRNPRHARWIMTIVLLFFAADVVATYATFSSRVPGANDFYSR